MSQLYLIVTLFGKVTLATVYPGTEAACLEHAATLPSHVGLINRIGAKPSDLLAYCRTLTSPPAVGSLYN